MCIAVSRRERERLKERQRVRTGRRREKRRRKETPGEVHLSPALCARLCRYSHRRTRCRSATSRKCLNDCVTGQEFTDRSALGAFSFTPLFLFPPVGPLLGPLPARPERPRDVHARNFISPQPVPGARVRVSGRGISTLRGQPFCVSGRRGNPDEVASFSLSYFHFYSARFSCLSIQRKCLGCPTSMLVLAGITRVYRPHQRVDKRF